MQKRGKRAITVFLCFIIACSLTVTMTLAESSANSTEQSVQIIHTDFEADRVVNWEGYAALNIKGAGAVVDYETGTLSYSVREPQCALIDRNGNILFDYQTKYPDAYTYENEYKFVVSDGMAQLTCQSMPQEGQFYDLSKKSILTLPFQLEDYRFPQESNPDVTVTKYTQFEEVLPFRDGISFVREQAFASITATGSGGVDEHAIGYLIDKSGKILYTLPDEANDVTSVGAGGRSYFGNCTSAGDGLIGYYTAGWDIQGEFPNFTREWVSQLVGYMDYSGNMVLPLSGYSSGNGFYGGLAAVKSSITNLIGFINTSGELVIPCQYDYVLLDFTNGYTAVEKDGKFGYIDKGGNVVIPIEYDNAYGAGDDLFSVVKNGKCGLVDIHNDIVVPLEYDDISAVVNGVAYAVKDRKLDIITVKQAGDGIELLKSLARKIAHIEPITDITVADINGDETVNAKDLTALARLLLSE